MKKNKNTLAAILSVQGFGTRKECVHMVRKGQVELGYFENADANWMIIRNPDEPIITKGLNFKVGSTILPYKEDLHIIMHKPSEVECSHSPSNYQSVFALLPPSFLNRKIEAVGRLDADTTGMLLLSDSGKFNHFFTSPKHNISKTYRVGTKHPISNEQIMKLTEGVQLHSETGLTLPAVIKLVSEKVCDMTLHEGKYHQVKRMFAAVSNRVESIHRIAIGGFELEDSLMPGDWRFLTDADLDLLGYNTNTEQINLT